MYKPIKIEQQFFKHQMQAHNGKTNTNCPFCRAYKLKIEQNNKKDACSELKKKEGIK